MATQRTANHVRDVVARIITQLNLPLKSAVVNDDQTKVTFIVGHIDNRVMWRQLKSELDLADVKVLSYKPRMLSLLVVGVPPL